MITLINIGPIGLFAIVFAGVFAASQANTWLLFGVNSWRVAWHAKRQISFAEYMRAQAEARAARVCDCGSCVARRALDNPERAN